MNESLCLLVPEALKLESEAVLKNPEAPVFGDIELTVSSLERAKWEEWFEYLKPLRKKYEKFLVLCEGNGPEVPEECKKWIQVHSLGKCYKAFAGDSILREPLEQGARILLPGKLESCKKGEKETEGCENESNALHPSSLLILDTGLYPCIGERAEKLSRDLGMPYKVLEIGLDFFRLYLTNIILSYKHEHLIEKKKETYEKSASYAMALDILRELMSAESESEAIEGITEIFKMLFAPGELIYHTLEKKHIYGTQVQEPDLTDIQEPKSSNLVEKKIKEPIGEYKNIEENYLDEVSQKFIQSEDKYLIEENGRGFYLKIQNGKNVLGIVKAQDILFPEYLDRYLNLAADITAVCGLVISNSRRYNEIENSRKMLEQYSDILKVINRIIRHDVSNELNVILLALNLFQEKGDEKYIPLAVKAVNRSVETIDKMRELENVVSRGGKLNGYNIQNVVEKIIKDYPVEFKIEGNCTPLVDEAFPSVMENIIRNAVTHGKTDRIDVSIKREEKHCIIKIADYGKGIPDSAKTRIFEEGFKFGDSGNTGVGLYIVKKVVERYDGCIAVEDNQPKGTAFIIKLKCAAEQENSGRTGSQRKYPLQEENYPT